MAEPPRAYYAIIPANVRYDPELPANAKLLYGEITALCNERGYCWASNQYFAELYNVSIRTVQMWVKQLTERGYVQIEMQFNPGTREVDYRRITLSGIGGEKNFTTSCKNLHQGGEENFTTPGEKNFTHNNTSMNNTENNISFSLSRAREEKNYEARGETSSDLEQMLRRVREQAKTFGI